MEDNRPLGTDGAGKGTQKSEREQKTTVAAGIAFTVVVLLMGVWFMVFFKNVLRGEPVQTPWGERVDSVDFSSVKEAAQQFGNTYQEARDSLSDLKEAAQRAQREAARQEAGGGSGAAVYDINAGGSANTNEFGI